MKSELDIGQSALQLHLWFSTLLGTDVGIYNITYEVSYIFHVLSSPPPPQKKARLES